MSRVFPLFLRALSGGLPLLIGCLGIAALVIDVFGIVTLADGYESEILLAAASVVLLGYFAHSQLLAEHGNKQESLLLDVRTVLDRVDARLDVVRQVPAAEIRPLLEQHVSGANEYLFRGGSGRWLRRFTLPELAKTTEREVRITIELMDPRDGALCEAYAAYRRQALPEGNRREAETARLIQRDILGSVYAAAWYTANKRTKATVILLRSFSPLRYDVSSEGMLITVAQLSQPGLFAAPGTWLHSSIVDELHQARHGHATLRLPPASECPYPQWIESTTPDDVQRVLSATLIAGPDGGPLLERFAACGDIEWEEVAKSHVQQ